MKIIEKTFNLETGETTYIERDATAEEIAASDLVIANAQAKAEEEEAKTTAKAAAQAKLAALGLTTDDLKALGL